MLGAHPGQRVLELACGNGGFARRLATQGIDVLATDLSPTLIAAAERRTRAADLRGASFAVLDATDERAIVDTAATPFDGAVCVMGVMSMPLLRPLFGGVSRALKPRGPFVVLTLHPAYATAANRFAKSEEEDQPHGLTVTRYLSRFVTHGVTNVEQKERQVYFPPPARRTAPGRLRRGPDARRHGGTSRAPTTLRGVQTDVERAARDPDGHRAAFPAGVVIARSRASLRLSREGRPSRKPPFPSLLRSETVAQSTFDAIAVPVGATLVVALSRDGGTDQPGTEGQPQGLPLQGKQELREGLRRAERTERMRVTR